jgi:hypothetical protein
MKPALKLILIVVLYTATLLQIPSSTRAHNINKKWAVLISGFSDPSENMDRDFSILKSILSTYYGFADSNMFFQLYAISETVHSALTDWLASRSNYGDLVFIFIASHGGGYNNRYGQIEGGRIDADGDEGPEVYNATSGKWFGVDECLHFQMDRSLYWDDQMKQDLATIKYGRMIAFIYGCEFENSTEHCFSGGFIDDISGPRRIIVTSGNETWYSWAAGYPIQRGYFSRYFIDSLDPNSYHFRNADTDGDGAISVCEAFMYAYQNDPRRTDPINGETPWMDSNGDRRPTFLNGQDQGGHYEVTYFATQTWLNNSMYTGNVADVNNDGCVDMADIDQAVAHFGGECDPYANQLWDPLVDVNYDNLNDMADISIIIDQFGWEK